MSSDTKAPGVTVTRKDLHDLMNHLCVALGHSELLALELPADHPSRAVAIDIRDACSNAVELARLWSSDSRNAR